MTSITRLTRVAGAAVLVLAAADAFAQYQVPLRYDLRYASPSYIPSDTLRSAPPPVRQADPYAFGTYSYGNLGLTGNLRAGKSFQGDVPYGQSGSQLSRTLPSLSLSNFRRDSVGVDDVGTGVEYGLPTPYFPASGSVTTPYAARNRFDVPPPGDRAPYTVPNYSSPLPAGGATPSGEAYLGFGVGSRLTPAGVPAPGHNLTIPRSALDWIDSLIAGREQAPGAPRRTDQPAWTDPRIGLPGEPADPRIGWGLSRPAATEDQPAEEKVPDPVAGLFRDARREAEPSAGGPTAATPTTPTRPAPAVPDETELGAAAPGEPKPEAPVPTERFAAPAGYGDYLARARTALQEADYGRAEALFAAAAALEPDRPDPALGRLNALLARLHYEQATVVARRTFLQHPDWICQVPDLRAAYGKPDVLERIVADLRRDARRAGQAPAALLLAYVLQASGQSTEARQLLAERARTEGGPEAAMLKALEAAAPTPAEPAPPPS